MKKTIKIRIRCKKRVVSKMNIKNDSSESAKISIVFLCFFYSCDGGSQAEPLLAFTLLIYVEKSLRPPCYSFLAFAKYFLLVLGILRNFAPNRMIFRFLLFKRNASNIF